MIDITKNRKQIQMTVDNGLYGNMGDSVKMKSGFALVGSAIGFCWAISKRQNWFPYTVGGLVVGSIAGWAVDALFMNKEKTV